MTEPAVLPEDVPAVSLGGRLWPIPELAVRQLRVVRRPIIDLTEAIEATETQSTGQRVMALGAEQYQAMIDVVYHGLTRAHPALTRDEFFDMAASDAELFLAFLVVRRQSGIYVLRPAGEAATPGEACPIPTGTG